MVTILSRKIIDGLRPSTDVSWSLFTIGEPLQIEIEFEVFTLKTFTTNSPLQFGSVATVNPYALANTSGRFSGLNVGDTIKVINTSPSISQNATILSVVNSNLIITDVDWVALLGGYTNLATAGIYNITPITGVGMPYNFIENNDPTTYISLTTGDYQKLFCDNVDASDTTPKTMFFDGLTPYQIGSATIQGVSYDTANGRQIFKIIHNTFVTPLFLATQYAAITTGQGQKPTYYANNRCLKHIYSIEAYANYANPNSKQVGDSPLEVGNSGWFNEVFNGGNGNYKIQNIVFNAPINDTTLYLNDSSQTIEFDITSVDGHFTTLTALEVGFCKLPNTISEYTANANTFDENFLFTNTVGNTSGSDVTPPSAATNYRSIDHWTATIVDVNTIHVTVSILFGTDALTVFQRSTTPRFMFWATISNPALTTAATQNKQALLCGVYDLELQFNQPLLAFNKVFLRHFEQAGDVGVSGTVYAVQNDECAMTSQIILSPATYPQLTKITSISNQIIAKKTDGTEFIIEDYTLPITYSSIGTLQVINYSNQRVFQIPTSEVRKVLTVSGGNIVGAKIIFDVNFPFMIRWEDWVALATASMEFYNTGQPNNGLNNEWTHYQTVDWQIYHRIAVNLTYNGSPMYFKEDTLFDLNVYENNPDYTTKDVETFTLAGASLYDSSNSRWYIQSFANTLVKATFVKNIPIDIDKCYVVFGIEIFEQGGIGGRQRYSSKWQTSNPLTSFIPFTTGIGNRVKLEQPATDTIVAKAILDFNLLPIGNITYSIVARLYEDDGTAGNKITEDGIDKITEDDIQKIIE
jgi:hypothetical protein